jgi:phage gpG-like protein
VDIEGVEAVAKLLDGMRLRIERWTDTAPRLHDFLLVRQRDLFATGGSSEGMKWAGYGGEPKYKAWKQAVLGDLTVLRWKGGKNERLYPSLTDPRHPHHVFDVGSNRVAMGTSLSYAKRLHRGGKNMFGEPMPARPLVGLGERSTMRLAQLLAVYIARGNSRGNTWSR